MIVGVALTIVINGATVATLGCLGHDSLLMLQLSVVVVRAFLRVMLIKVIILRQWRLEAL